MRFDITVPSWCMLCSLLLQLSLNDCTAVDPGIVSINCDRDTLRESVCKGRQGHDIQSLPASEYPEDGFCLIYNSTMVTVPGLIKYSITAPLCRTGSSGLHGDGMYFNFQDPQNYEVFYMYSRDSFTCVIGYVEDGIVYNTTVFWCPNWNNWDTWTEYSVDINSTHGQASVTDGITLTHTHTFTPHFPMSSVGGPMILNSMIHYRFLEFGSSTYSTATCQTSPDLCDPCEFAYNVVNQPVYPLPSNQNLLLWYSRALEMVYKACYIKVRAETTKQDVVVNATSKVGTLEYQDGQFSIKPGDFYGERHSCVSNKTACLQVKAAGSVTNGPEMFMDRTNLLITLPTENFPSVQVNHALNLIYGDAILGVEPSTFSMYLDDRVYGADFGIYCFTSKNVIQAEERALNMCLNGKNDPRDPPLNGINPDGWAVRFSK